MGWIAEPGGSVHQGQDVGDELLGLLARAAACSANDTDLPPDVQHRFAKASARYLEGAGNLTFDDALGLKGTRGLHSLPRRLLRAQCGIALAGAFNTIDATLSNWRRSEILALEIADFEKSYWPAWKEHGLPAGSSALRSALFKLFELYARADNDPPHNQRAIWNTLQRVLQLK